MKVFVVQTLEVADKSRYYLAFASIHTAAEYVERQLHKDRKIEFQPLGPMSCTVAFFFTVIKEQVVKLESLVELTSTKLRRSRT